MKGFGEWEKPIKEYCDINNIDFSKIEKLTLEWAMDRLFIKNDEKTVLFVAGCNPKNLHFEQTEYTKQYLN